MRKNICDRCYVKRPDGQSVILRYMKPTDKGAYPVEIGLCPACYEAFDEWLQVEEDDAEWEQRFPKPEESE